MKAMILAAGLGTRLKPLTDTRPKALVEVNGITLLDMLLRRLIKAGFLEIIINVHHFAGQVIGHLERSSYPGIRIEISDETEQLLDTGGAILKARWFLDGHEPFLVHNVDVISGVDLPDLMKAHHQDQPLVTLAVSERMSSRYFLMDENLRLCGWENASTHDRIITEAAPAYLRKLAFSGIHVINPAIFRYITQTGRFSIIQAYLQLCSTYTLRGYIHDPAYWFDLGKKDHLSKAEKYMRQHPDQH